VQAIARGAYHACAVESGGVQCWGDNADGELGNDATTSSNLPVQVYGLSGGVQSIVAGAGDDNGFTCALLASGAVECWGDNGVGTLGNNSTTYSHVPVTVGPWAP
jgi:alpha-tubulin suppressor-like RCC1 family protein